MSNKMKKERRRIMVAGAIFAALMIAEHAFALPEAFDNRWVMMMLYMIPYMICGWPVLRKCGKGIANRQMFDESFLMTIATVGAFATGQNSEAVAVILFYQVGEFFQEYAVGESRRAISDLMDIAPEYANLEHDDGSVETVDPDDIEVGNILVIKPGEKIPVDGVVIDGSGLVNTSALTGESVPRSVKAGEQIISGCVNGESLIKIRAEKKYEDSTVAQILELVENASSKKSKTENFITRFARYYTPAVVFGAVALAFIPPIFVGNWSMWVLRACTFLVISCPCALVISIPLSFFGGIGAASKAGVLVKGSNYLELMANIDTLVTDKTGTLTKGEFKVNDITCAEGVEEEELLRIASLAEGLSTHPIAVSIREAYGREVNTKLVTATENISGRGLRAEIDGKTVIVGNAKLMTDEGVIYNEEDDKASTIVYVAEDGKFLGTISVSDAPKDGAKKAVADIRAAGVHSVVMLTGDRRETGDAVGKELGIDKVRAELLPVDKVAEIEKLMVSEDRNGGVLAFVGDGINDAPVLARADVGIAMGSLGSDAAIEAADIVIMDDDLRRIPKLISIARKTVRIARQNIVFALTVKAVFLMLGALGIAGMWAAVFADVGVAILCILNSMRMLRAKKP